MTRRGLQRRFASIDIAVEELHDAASRAGRSINDAFLAAVLLGLSKYHELHNVAVEQLRVAVPVSLRTDADRIGGNRVTVVRLALPANVSDPVELMHQIDTTINTMRHDPAVPLSNAIAGALNLLPTGYLASVLKHVDFVASDVPGSPVPMYVAGAEIERYYAFGPTLGTALNVTLMSHNGTCCVGINADSASVPDLAVLTACLEGGFRSVLAVGAASDA
jgi:hypothetical protein